MLILFAINLIAFAELCLVAQTSFAPNIDASESALDKNINLRIAKHELFSECSVDSLRSLHCIHRESTIAWLISHRVENQYEKTRRLFAARCVFHMEHQLSMLYMFEASAASSWVSLIEDYVKQDNWHLQFKDVIKYSLFDSKIKMDPVEKKKSSNDANQRLGDGTKQLCESTKASRYSRGNWNLSISER